MTPSLSELAQIMLIFDRRLNQIETAVQQLAASLAALDGLRQTSASNSSQQAPSLQAQGGPGQAPPNFADVVKQKRVYTKDQMLNIWSFNNAQQLQLAHRLAAQAAAPEWPRAGVDKVGFLLNFDSTSIM